MTYRTWAEGKDQRHHHVSVTDPHPNRYCAKLRRCINEKRSPWWVSLAASARVQKVDGSGSEGFDWGPATEFGAQRLPCTSPCGCETSTEGTIKAGRHCEIQ